MNQVYEVPEVGEGVIEVELLEWKVAVGDAVSADQPLCDVSTDKATIEISSPYSGTIAALHAGPGDVVKVHAALVTFGEASDAQAPPAGEAEVRVQAQAPSEADAPPTSVSGPAAPAAAPKRASTPQAQSAQPPSAANQGNAKAAPAVRKRAHELGIDLGEVSGSGPGGRVVRADLDAAEQGAAAAIAPPAVRSSVARDAPRAGRTHATAEDEHIPMRGVRRKIAERMQEAKRTAPHFTYVEEVDCEALVALRTRLKARAAQVGVKLSYLPILAKACSVVFRRFPEVNAWMHGDELVIKGAHHFGFACDTPSGLLVPVLRHVEQKSILTIAEELQDLLGRAREGKAARDELSGSTFTITSIGNLGGVLATPILNVPEVAVMGVNQIRRRPVAVGDAVEVRSMMYLSPSFDHRVIDGAVAARFTSALRDLLEEPDSLLLELV